MATAEQIPQHMQALQRANEIRVARADLKQQVRDGRITAAAIILNTPPFAESMTLGELLLSQRRWGYQRMSAFLARVGLSEVKTLGSLSDKQRGPLARSLGPVPAHVPFAVEELATRNGVRR